MRCWMPTASPDCGDHGARLGAHSVRDVPRPPGKTCEGSVTQNTLSRKALNRALLARQMLLTRAETSATAMMAHLVGLQAQQARPPFVGLWSRIKGFGRGELRSLVESRG